jgi:hypothetical protein
MRNQRWIRFEDMSGPHLTNVINQLARTALGRQSAAYLGARSEYDRRVLNVARAHQEMQQRIQESASGAIAPGTNILERATRAPRPRPSLGQTLQQAVLEENLNRAHAAAMQQRADSAESDIFEALQRAESVRATQSITPAEPEKNRPPRRIKT